MHSDTTERYVIERKDTHRGTFQCFHFKEDFNQLSAEVFLRQYDKSQSTGSNKQRKPNTQNNDQDDQSGGVSGGKSGR